jgi:methylated-DNA-[protein]-cysteine S-methyltransferase
MRCETVRRLADAFRTGELGGRAAVRIRAHLQSCSGCSGEILFLRSLASAGRELRVQAPGDLIRKVGAGTGDRFGRVDTRLGPVWVGFSRRGLTLLKPGEMSPPEFGELYRKVRGRVATPAKLPADLARIVRLAADGRLNRPARVDMTGLTGFQQKVLELLQTIPRGEVRTYAWLAREVGRPRAARAVGNVMAGNPVPWILPCHRVVPSQGGVGNYAFGSEMKRDLLRREGARP